MMPLRQRSAQHPTIQASPPSNDLLRRSTSDDLFRLFTTHCRPWEDPLRSGLVDAGLRPKLFRFCDRLLMSSNRIEADITATIKIYCFGL
jgi:hypothetical protein